MLGKKKKDTANQTSSLGPNLSFLDVVQDACRKGGRYTLTADFKGLIYTVLVDRGGPFNVSGGGLSGSGALAIAATLRDGTYAVAEGWPVDQPLYQLGLDATLNNLLLGSARTEVPELPPTRGVDYIRNAAFSLDQQSTATATAEKPPTPPSSVPALALPTVTAAAILAPPVGPQVAPTLAPTAAPAATPTPALAPAPARAPQPAAAPRSDTTPGAGREMGFGESIELDAAMPSEAGASEKQGQLKHLATQALLWTVQVEEPGRYTLQQSWILVLRALRSAFSVFIDPFERELGQRWSRAKEDWRKSGESVAKDKSRKKTRPNTPE